MSTATLARKQEARANSERLLRKWLQPGDTVYSVLRKRGTDAYGVPIRNLDFYAVVDGGLMYLSGYIADVTTHRRNQDGQIRTTDDPFGVVYHLSAALFDDGYALKHDRI